LRVEQHTPFLICVPIAFGADLPGVAARRVEESLDRLGNPAAPALQASLDASGVIHFISMTVVWDENSADPPMLVAHVAGDGTPKTIIAAVVKYAGVLLLPVFKAAADVENLKDLQKLLRRRWVGAAPVSVSLWPHRATGLPFQGTPGLTVARIKEDARIARDAKAAVLSQVRRGPSTPQSTLAAARHAAGISRLGAEPFLGPQATPAMAKADLRAKALILLGVGVLAWLCTAILLLAAFILNAKFVLHPKYNSEYIALLVPPALGLGLFLDLAITLISRIFRTPGGATTLRVLAVIPVILATLHALSESRAILGPRFADAWIQPFTWWMASVLGLVALVLFVGVVAGAFLTLLRWYEKRATPDDTDQDPLEFAEIMQREDQPTHRQNHIFSAATIPPGFFRRFVSLPLGLYVAALTVRAGFFKRGFLAGIATIHFIQWACLPGTRKLVFCGDYDGSWQAYLEDAITQLPPGATGIWSNAVGFPKTKWLFGEGAVDGDRFKRWVRRQMIPTRFWYSAYPDLTTAEIRLNASIRSGLESKRITPIQTDAWLSLFGSSPRPASEIETDQIQGVALTGYRKLPEGALLAVAFSEDPAACRDWLADVSSRIDFGDTKPKQQAIAVALSAQGLKRLGLEATHPLAAQFSSPFVMGMASETRSKALGDYTPASWAWGGPDSPIDAVMLLYASDSRTMRGLLRDEDARCKQAGFGSPHQITLARLPPARHPRTNQPVPITEPFGFVDGISQPSIKGLRSANESNHDALEPGEFILGYVDGRKRFPSTPQALASEDPLELLPELPAGFPGQPSKTLVRDLGRNGSYLVVRQLRQDVAGFREYVKAAAAQVGSTPEELAAKMVGRWHNGAPLVLYPHAPPDSYDPTQPEDFLFGRDDPRGVACPFGAHIRRANPRDHFDPGNPTQISINNRHRILRRGRSYVTGDNSGAPAEGLLFMCLNADIERQFEFLQQTWIGSTSFVPFSNEADPIMASAHTSGTYTIPTTDGPKQVTGMPSFVSMVGGGYFFLPGRQALKFLSS